MDKTCECWQTSPELMNFHWAPGPGQRIQKMMAPHKGRLIACGHMNTDEDHSMVCIYSDGKKRYDIKSIF